MRELQDRPPPCLPPREPPHSLEPEQLELHGALAAGVAVALLLLWSLAMMALGWLVGAS